VFKLVTVQAEGQLLLVSLNTAYKPYTVSVENVLELWAFERYISKELPEKASDMDELKAMILGLKEEMSKRK
jgi:hypothetical protein